MPRAKRYRYRTNMIGAKEIELRREVSAWEHVIIRLDGVLYLAHVAGYAQDVPYLELAHAETIAYDGTILAKV